MRPLAVGGEEPVLRPYEASGPLGDYAPLVDLHRRLFTRPRMQRAMAFIKYRGDGSKVDWEGEPWWPATSMPAEAKELVDKAPLFLFSMPVIERDEGHVHEIEMHVAGITIDLRGTGSNPAYRFHLVKDDDGWREGCTVTMTIEVITDVVEAVGNGDIADLLQDRGVAMDVPCPVLGHCIQGNVLEVATTTIVMAALREDSKHHGDWT